MMSFVLRQVSLPAIVCGLLCGNAAIGQIVPPTPILPHVGVTPQSAPVEKPADKPSRSMFDAPLGVAGQAMESLKRSIAPIIEPSSKDDRAPGEASTQAEKETQSDRSPHADIKDDGRLFPTLKRLRKNEILTAVTGTFTAYVLQGDERTIVIDFPSPLAQAQMLGRVILFVERNGTPKTRIMTVPEVKKWLAQNTLRLEAITMGNNIRSGELARFFNTARLQNEPLTVDEKRLYDWLLQVKLFYEESNGVSISSPEVILISVPQVFTAENCAECSISFAQREVALKHELSHARFVTDTAYQSYVLWFWSQVMPPAVRKKFTQFLLERGYDPNNRELLANEMQAFLMHTSDPAMFRAAHIGMTVPELENLRLQFQAGLFPSAPAMAENSYRLE